jgi:hypothetical protein
LALAFATVNWTRAEDFAFETRETRLVTGGTGTFATLWSGVT